ncbi:Disintegrin domain-containing protein [Plasmodiophora brassicae]
MPPGILVVCVVALLPLTFTTSAHRLGSEAVSPDIRYTDQGLHVDLNVLGSRFTLSLTANRRWLSPTFRSLDLYENGALVQSDAKVPDQHYEYAGGGPADPIRHASLSSFRSGIIGLIRTRDGRAIHLEPFDDQAGTHMAHVEADRDATPTLADTRDTGTAIRGSKSKTKCSIDRYVQVLVVNDFDRYSVLSNDTMLQTSAIVNIADGYYNAADFVMCIHVVLIGQLTFRSGTPAPIKFRPCNTTSTNPTLGVGCYSCGADGRPPCDLVSKRPDQYDSTVLLSSFLHWRTLNDEQLHEHFGDFDVVHMFSGNAFDGPIKGLAYLGSICTDAAVAVIETTSKVLTYSAQIFTHELGHNFGLTHDSTRGYIMSPTSSSWSFSTAFSSQSTRQMDGAVNQSACLSSRPVAPPTNGTCGNGFVDPGEECDPGLGSDTCCVRCRVNRPQCACANSQPCCKNGQFLAKGSVCRPAKNDECDVAETCTGTSGDCPADAFMLPNTSCTDWMGLASNCYLGACALSRDGQCMSVNVPGVATLTKSQILVDSSARSCPSTRLCSRLQCRTKSDTTTCSQLWSSDADDGSPCGPDGPTDSRRVCVAGYCVDSVTASDKSFTCKSGDTTCVIDDMRGAQQQGAWTVAATILTIALLAIVPIFACCVLVQCCKRGFRCRRKPSGPPGAGVPMDGNAAA